ncbi:dyslexia-associated protein KIAA0319 isoform X2 [Denticeps clupeoides]|uniref:dyslexia-associated protein KIAA0319 isoform X2 n=1 Tax=Denticeps clupeoides TaxID=299321 RepID=UPI0010A2B2A2|nr:dyslexia-associated protein KIAA0319-like isoform X2 [Denticeps clupeoides]
MGVLLFLYPLLHILRGALAGQCWQGASYSETIISPDLKSRSILRVPDITSLAQCAGACCDLPGCDLAWFFERRCYVLNCQRKENCVPKQRPGTDSYMVFLQRGPPQTLVLQSLVRGEPYRWPHVNRHHGAEAPLKHLALFQGVQDLDNADLEYPENYRAAEEEEEGDVMEGRDYLKEGLGLPEWSDIQGREGMNVSDAEEVKNKSALQDLMGMSSPSAMQNESGQQVHTGTTVQTSAAVPEPENQLNSLPSPEALTLPQNVTTDLTQLSQTRRPTPPHPQMTVPTGTPQAAIIESALQVSIGDPVDLTLPLNTVVLTACATPEASKESPYLYDWSWVNTPEDHSGVMDGENSKSVKISGLSEGLYTVKVSVTGQTSFGESFVNITVSSGRLNKPPKAIAFPECQGLLLPADSTVVNGSESTDDHGIVRFHWEQVTGQSLGNLTSAETPVLHLRNLIEGEYTFRLTVTDTEGLTDSTTVSVRVTRPSQDSPPVANAGLDEVITLPLDHLILNGNMSKDDLSISSYLWTLHPNSQAKAVTLQGVRSPFLQLSGLQEGQYTFQLTVVDSGGQENSSTITVTVLPENRAPVAVAGSDRQLILPVSSVTLDGSSSSDDQGISSFRWDVISGPPGAKIQDANNAATVVTGLRAGTYKFKLTVKDQHGAADSAFLAVTLKEAKSLPLVAHASGSHTLTLPNNSLVLRGSVSNSGPANMSFLWVRDDQSPAAGDVLYSSEHQASLYLANLVEGTYLFQLRVTDARGRSSSATATVEVRPDPRAREEVELELQVGVSQVSHQQRDTVLRQLAALLHVLDSDIAVKGLHGQSDISTVMRFSVQGLDGVIPGPKLTHLLRTQLLKEKTDFLLFKVLRVDTVMCLLHCSGQGQCDPVTKRCSCDPLWMENPFRRLLDNEESNCEWSVLYVILTVFVGVVLIVSVSWACFCCCKRSRRTKVRKKTKYTILDNMDEQERMELRPKYYIKHRSTEHNSSLMMSESEFESEQDTLFGHERSERPRNRCTGKNGDAFNFRPVDG